MVDYAIEGDVLVLIFGQRFDTEEILAAVARATADRAWSPPMKLLIDNRDSREAASADEIKRRATLLSRASDFVAGRCAVVVSDELHYALARQGGSFVPRDSPEVRVFYDMESARSWLAEAF